MDSTTRLMEALLAPVRPLVPLGGSHNDSTADVSHVVADALAAASNETTAASHPQRVGTRLGWNDSALAVSHGSLGVRHRHYPSKSSAETLSPGSGLHDTVGNQFNDGSRTAVEGPPASGVSRLQAAASNCVRSSLSTGWEHRGAGANPSESVPDREGAVLTSGQGGDTPRDGALPQRVLADGTLLSAVMQPEITLDVSPSESGVPLGFATRDSAAQVVNRCPHEQSGLGTARLKAAQGVGPQTEAVAPIEAPGVALAGLPHGQGVTSPATTTKHRFPTGSLSGSDLRRVRLNSSARNASASNNSPPKGLLFESAVTSGGERSTSTAAVSVSQPTEPHQRTSMPQPSAGPTVRQTEHDISPGQGNAVATPSLARINGDLERAIAQVLIAAAKRQGIDV